MAKTNYEYQEDRIVPTATGIMSPFTNLKENTDGTVGKIDGVNTRSECITRDHLDDPNAVGDTLTRGYIASAVTISTTSFSDVQDIPYVKTIGTTDMLRIEFNPFATVTAYTGGGGTPDDKGATNYYLQIFYTPSGGGSDVPISPIFGFGTITDGRGFTGSRSETSTFYTRNPVSYIWMPAASTAITNIVLKGRVDNGTNCTVRFENRQGFLIQPNY